jgi:nicotinate-nucleotide pyrophosphorylase (carboxylating)
LRLKHYNGNMITPLFTQTISRDSFAFTQLVDASVKNSLAEDIGTGDLTAQLIPADASADATIISREDAVICGIDWVNACFQQLDPKTTIDWKVKEGDAAIPNQVLCNIAGNARTMLTAERTALNFLQTLSATATETKKYVDAISGLSTQVLDTRKTLPGLRMAQKYAVTVGGGHNQRLALYDGILIKENHIAVAGSIKAVLDAAYQLNNNVSIQIEVENTQQLKEALAAGAESILLDNFNNEQLREAVSLNQGRAVLEASGNVNLDTIRAIAETGVDRISIGGLTKHVKAIDLSMRIKMYQN